MSRSSKAEAPGAKQKSQKTESGLDTRLDTRRVDNTIAHLNSVIAKEKSKVRELKNLYMKEMGNKSELEKVVRSLVEDVRGSIIEVEKSKNATWKKGTEMST